MRGNELKALAEVADLARLDFEAASITLVKDESKGYLVSRYRGAYSSGQRWMELEDIPDVATSVSAMQFKSLVGLFEDEEEIDFIVQPNVITLKSSIKKVDLNTRGEPEQVEPYEPTETTFLESTVSILLREAECASEFSARSMAKPILTGLRISGAKGRLGIQSSDGVSTLFESMIDVIGKTPISMIAPAYDLVLGLRLLDSGTVKLMRTPNHVVLYGANAMFKSTLLLGEWPDFSRVRAPQHRQSAKLPTSLVRSLVQSVRILGTSNDLRLRGDGEHLYLETVEGEAGHFEAKVPSSIKGTYVFDVSSFLLAQELGPELIVQLPNEPKIPTLVESGTRRFWIASRL